MANTTDSFNYVLESLRTHLASNVTDPVSFRDSNRPFILIGPTLRNPQFPYIHIIHSGNSSEEVALGAVINGGAGATFAFMELPEVTIQIFTREEVIANSMSNDKLLHNLASQVKDALLKKSNKQALEGSYDIKQVTLINTTNVIGPDEDGVLQLPLIFDLEFLQKY